MRLDSLAVIAHDDFYRLRAQVQLDMQRPLGAVVCVQDNVVARLRDSRTDVVQLDTIYADRVREPAQRLAHEQDVLGLVRDGQTDVWRVRHQRTLLGICRRPKVLVQRVIGSVCLGV